MREYLNNLKLDYCRFKQINQFVIKGQHIYFALIKNNKKNKVIDIDIVKYNMETKHKETILRKQEEMETTKTG